MSEHSSAMHVLSMTGISPDWQTIRMCRSMGSSFRNRESGLLTSLGPPKQSSGCGKGGERPASWVLLLELTRTHEELTIEELTDRNLALLEEKTLPTDEALLRDHPSLMSGSIRIGDDKIRPIPVSKVELLPKAFEAMSEHYRDRDSKMAWKRRIAAALVALGGPGATDEELSRASDAESSVMRLCSRTSQAWISIRTMANLPPQVPTGTLASRLEPRMAGLGQPDLPRVA